jgi:hypothetical protein
VAQRTIWSSASASQAAKWTHATVLAQQEQEAHGPVEVFAKQALAATTQTASTNGRRERRSTSASLPAFRAFNRQLWVGLRRPPDQSQSPEAVVETARLSPVRRRTCDRDQAAFQTRWVNYGVRLIPDTRLHAAKPR